MTNIVHTVAPFRAENFRSYSEFKSYMATSEAKLSLRWLFEQSLASTESRITSEGTCGLCMAPTAFQTLQLTADKLRRAASSQTGVKG